MLYNISIKVLKNETDASSVILTNEMSSRNLISIYFFNNCITEFTLGTKDFL